MGRKKKDSKPLNVHIEAVIFDEMEAYCLASGRSKTIVTERALRMYLDAEKEKATEGAV